MEKANAKKIELALNGMTMFSDKSIERFHSGEGNYAKNKICQYWQDFSRFHRRT
jgi:hypothetical protein